MCVTMASASTSRLCHFTTAPSPLPDSPSVCLSLIPPIHFLLTYTTLLFFHSSPPLPHPPPLPLPSYTPLIPSPLPPIFFLHLSPSSNSSSVLPWTHVLTLPGRWPSRSCLVPLRHQSMPRGAIGS